MPRVQISPWRSSAATLLALTLALGLVAALAAPAGAAAKHGHHHHKHHRIKHPRLRLFTKTQAGARHGGALRVRVFTTRAGSARVAASGMIPASDPAHSSDPSAHARLHRITRERKLHFDHRGGRTVKLHLNRAGRRMMRRCASQGRPRVVARARVRLRARRRHRHGQRHRRGRGRGAALTGTAASAKAKKRRHSRVRKPHATRHLRTARRNCPPSRPAHPQPPSQPTTPSTPTRPSQPSRPPLDHGQGVDLAHADRCDFIAGSRCLFPWPNDRFTRPDPSTPTGLRLDVKPASVPANKDGAQFDTSSLNRSDGFSPGSPIVLKVPGLDTPKAFARTGAVPVTDMAQTYRPDQPIVVIDASTGRRQLIWSELDSNAGTAADTTLIIHPAVNFLEGHRYIVALRDLKDAAGHTIQPQRGFELYRDGIRTDQPAIESRRAHFESLFRTLDRAGIERDDLYIAWDFTVASERSLAGPMLHIRNDAFAKLGDDDLADMRATGHAPAFNVDQVENFTLAQNADIARRVTGTFDVPCYLTTRDCATGGTFNYDGSGPDAIPTQKPGNVLHAQFICNIPRSALNADGTLKQTVRASLYGHGLLGSPTEVNAGNVEDMAFEHEIMFCATPWYGFASEDIPTAIGALSNLSKFPQLADRTQQGFLGFLYLGRLMMRPDGLGSDPAFRFAQSGGGPPAPVMGTPDRIYFDGNSQGGILGGALAALAPDYNRAVLGVPGMNYSVLLTRSKDFDAYSLVLYPNYPDKMTRPLMLSLIQTLWDRAEADGYAQHMTSDPLPDTPAHEVLMHEAFGDHQVADVTAETEARTIGAHVRTPELDPGRSPDVTPFYAIPPISSFPFAGSALVVWDSGPIRSDGSGGTLGTGPPPTTNTPPRTGEDPHELPRRSVQAREQKSAFLQPDGKVIDVCGGSPCYDGGWTGP